MMKYLPVAIAVTLASFPAAAQAERPNVQYMRQKVESMDIASDTNSGLLPRFSLEPILRFGDSTRDAVDGALWKLGSGRPQAIVAMEFIQKDDSEQLNYEFLCLSQRRIELSTEQGWKWAPSNSALTFKKLSGSERPAKQKRLRMGQIKRIARQFTSTEIYQQETFHLRLLTQPIDTYEIKHDDDAIHHGAAFVFANGTNPEVLLLVESTDSGWQYGFARLCGANAFAMLDGQIVWEVPDISEVAKS